VVSVHDPTTDPSAGLPKAAPKVNDQAARVAA
jgi:hypothetical protein